ncbi:MAG: cobalamin-binding protein [Deltaproteobacteria bacterium]|nr:cobalamin-binding protein [Deltaproteobacteria bacterium]
MEDVISPFETALLTLDRLKANEILEETSGTWSPMEQVKHVVVPTLERIGSGWETGRIALTQVYMAGRICEELVEKILPREAPDRKRQPEMAITVLQDYHLLGKRIVLSALRASGYELKDYGRMDANELVQQTLVDQIEILFISALMLPSALKVASVKKQLDQSKSPVRIVVGGAPFRLDETLWKEVGADAMGWDPSDAVSLIGKFTGVSS